MAVGHLQILAHNPVVDSSSRKGESAGVRIQFCKIPPSDLDEFLSPLSYDSRSAAIMSSTSPGGRQQHKGMDWGGGESNVRYVHSRHFAKSEIRILQETRRKQTEFLLQKLAHFCQISELSFLEKGMSLERFK